MCSSRTSSLWQSRSCWPCSPSKAAAPGRSPRRPVRVMLLWFAAIAVLGIVGVSRHPTVIAAVDPRYGIALLTGHGWRGIALLGGVFLAMTGGEAMYADMGHIGRNPIRTSWYGIV